PGGDSPRAPAGRHLVCQCSKLPVPFHPSWLRRLRAESADGPRELLHSANLPPTDRAVRIPDAANVELRRAQAGKPTRPPHLEPRGTGPSRRAARRGREFPCAQAAAGETLASPGG